MNQTNSKNRFNDQSKNEGLIIFQKNVPDQYSNNLKNIDNRKNLQKSQNMQQARRIFGKTYSDLDKTIPIVTNKSVINIKFPQVKHLQKQKREIQFQKTIQKLNFNEKQQKIHLENQETNKKQQKQKLPKFCSIDERFSISNYPLLSENNLLSPPQKSRRKLYNKKKDKKQSNKSSKESISRSSSKNSFNFSNKDLKMMRSPYSTNKTTYTIKTKKKNHQKYNIIEKKIKNKNNPEIQIKKTTLNIRQIILKPQKNDNQKQSKNNLALKRESHQQVKPNRISTKTDLLKRVESGLKWVIDSKLVKVKKLLSEDYKMQQAIQILNQVLQKEANNVQALYYFALICQKQKELQVSKRYYQSIVQLESQLKKTTKLNNSHKDAKQLVLLAISHQKLQNYKQALETCQFIQQLMSSQHHFKAIANQSLVLCKIKGVCQYKLRNYDQALRLFQEYLSMNQNKRETNTFANHQDVLQVLQNIGNIYLQYKLFQKALNYYNSYIQISKTSNLQQNQLIVFSLCDKTSESLNEIMKKKQQCLKQIDKYKKNKKQKNQDSVVDLLQSYLQQKNYLKAYQKIIQSQKTKMQYLNLNTQYKNLLIQGLKQKGFYSQAIQVLSLAIQAKFDSEDLKQRARLNFKIGQFQRCYEDFQRFVKLSETSPLTTFFDVNKYQKNNQSQKVFCALNSYLNKIKQLQVCSLTQSQGQNISARRNYNLGQAIKLFDSMHNSQNMEQSGLLSVIAQQSTISIIKDSKFYENANADIFALKQIRNALYIWKKDMFSLKSLDDITKIAFDLVKSDKVDFSIVPLHIVVYTIQKAKQKTFIEANKEIQSKIQKLSLSYPPSENDISQSKILNFNLSDSFKNKEKVNLFGDVLYFNSYKEIYKKISELSKEASNQKWLMDDKVKQICQTFGGYEYKSGLKLPFSEQDGSCQKIYCRIIQKILSKSLIKKKDQFLKSFNPKDKNFSHYFEQLMNKWQLTVDSILLQNKQNKISTPCYVYDLMRAKCMFKSVGDISKACSKFIQQEKKESFKIIEIDNRLQKKTKDVVLKIQFNKIVGQIQLALQFQSVKNQFNHGLYELCRSPFGPFFASFMWLSGFANKQNKLILKEKLKWDLKKLNHLKKFVYEDKLQLNFGQQQNIVSNQFKKLFITDFLVDTNSIQGYLMTENMMYLHMDQNSFSLSLSKQKPKQWFKLKLLKDSFAHDLQNYLVTIRLMSTKQFLCIQNNKLQFEQLNSSIKSNVFKIEFEVDKINKNYSMQIQQVKKLQKQVLQMILKH